MRGRGGVKEVERHTDITGFTSVEVKAIALAIVTHSATAALRVVTISYKKNEMSNLPSSSLLHTHSNRISDIAVGKEVEIELFRGVVCLCDCAIRAS